MFIYSVEILGYFYVANHVFFADNLFVNWKL